MKSFRDVSHHLAESVTRSFPKFADVTSYVAVGFLGKAAVHSILQDSVIIMDDTNRRVFVELFAATECTCCLSCGNIYTKPRFTMLRKTTSFP